MPLDLANDFKIFDGKKPVIIIQAGTGRQWRVEDALEFPVTSRDAIASDGTYTQSDAKFNLPVAQLLTFKPAPGDFVLTAAGELFTIGMVERLTLQSRLQPWGKKADLNPNTAEPVHVQRPIRLKDQGGAPYTDWKLAKETTAHINEVASEFEVAAGRKRLKITHTIYFVDQFKIEGGWRIVTAAGVQYNVQRVTGKSSLGVAVVADCELVRTPAAD